MASEIRANKSTNRAGLGTVTYADTGIIVSGIVTCTELSGLTALNISGVGTANTLDINGDIDVDGHTNLDNVSISGVTTITGALHADGFSTVGGEIAINGTVPRIGFTDSNANSDFRIKVDGGSFQIEDITNSSSDRLTINSSGNVSINKDLDVDGHTNLDNLSIAGIATFSGILDATNTPASIRVAQDIQHKGDADTKITFPANDTISFNTAGGERLRINSNGNVIIGTTTWLYEKPLNVQGSSGSILSLYNGDTTSYAANIFSGIELKLNTGNTGNTFGACEIRGIKEEGTNGNNARALTFYTGTNGGSNTERLRITSGGNVGIKSTAPRGRLDIEFDGAPSFITFGADADNPKVEFFRHTGGSPSHYATEIQMVLGDLVLSSATGIANLGSHSYSEKLRITSAGNVGIGSASPTSKLDVVGNVTVKSANNPHLFVTSDVNLNEHQYQSVRNGVTIKSNEARLDLIAHGNGTHAGSFLMRDSSHDGFGFVNDFDNKELQLKSFTSSGVAFRINSTGFNVSRLDNCIVIKKDGSVSLFHNGFKMLETKNYGFVSEKADANILVHHPSHSRGGLAALQNQRLALATTTNADDIVFGFGSAEPVTSSNFTERLRIDNGTGNVGINENSPASTLVVRKDNQGGRGGEITILNYAGGGSNGIGNEAALNFGLENSTYNADSGNAQIKAITTASNNSTDIIISNWSGTSFEERVRITSSGTFGVGTVNPDSNYKIDCNGVMRIGDGNAGRRIQFSRSGLGDELVIGVDGTGVGSANDAVIQSSPSFGRPLIFGTNNQERLRITSNGRVSINDGTRSADSATEGATLRVSGTPVTRNEYFSPHGHYFGSIGYTTDTHTKAWLAVDSHYAQSSAVSAGIFLSAFHQDAGGSDCGYTIKNLKTGNALVFSRVKTAASTGNPAVEEERVRITSDGNMGLGLTPSYSGIFGGSQRTFHIGGTAAPCLRITSSSSGQADLVIHAGNSARRVDIANLTANGSISIWTKPSSGSIQERIKISPEGFVQKPAQAMFEARGNNTAFSAQSPLPYPSVAYNIGDCYNNSTYKFTAPVDGYYQVMAHVIPTDYTAGGNNVELYVMDNHGTRYFLDRDVKSTNFASNNFSVGGTRIIYADAGDTLWLQFHSISGTPKVETASYFSIMLVA